MSGVSGGPRRPFTRFTVILSIAVTVVLLGPGAVIALNHIQDHARPTIVTFLEDMARYKPVYIWPWVFAPIWVVWGIVRALTNLE